MNGVHDMGGMQCMGPILAESNEPVFHQRWEGRVFALALVMFAWRKWNLDAFRYQQEQAPPVEYLRMSYYERWLWALSELLVKSGLTTRAELGSGKPQPGSPILTPPVRAEEVPLLIAQGLAASREVSAVARFRPGQRVRSSNIHPTGHTRLPRYARGKLGIVERDHGVFVFPDANAQFLGEKPQHLYTVRFAARELWGKQTAPRDAVYLNLWDDHLEPA